MLPPFSGRASRASGSDAFDRRSVRSIPALTLYRALVGFAIARRCRRRDRRRHVAQRSGALVLRSDHLGRLPDAEDRVPAGDDPVARPLRCLQDHNDGPRRDLPGGDRDHRRPCQASSESCSGRRATWAPTNANCCGRSCCRQPCRRFMTGLQVALPIAADRGGGGRDAMGGYGLGGAMMHGLALRQFAGRVRRHRRDRRGRLCAGRSMAMVRRRLLLWHPEAHAEGV